MFNFYSPLKQVSLLGRIGYAMGVIYSAPSGLSYLWNFGSLALLSLVVQLMTGILLAFFIRVTWT
jgi:quinol-cytochrome oxidoreductase complex cytochrome b subunit